MRRDKEIAAQEKDLLKRDKALKAAEKAAAAKMAKARSTDEKLKEREAAAKAKEVRFILVAFNSEWIRYRVASWSVLVSRRVSAALLGKWARVNAARAPCSQRQAY